MVEKAITSSFPEDLSMSMIHCLNRGWAWRELHNQGPDFDDKLSFFPCEIDDAIQYINLGYVAQASKIVIL